MNLNLRSIFIANCWKWVSEWACTRCVSIFHYYRSFMPLTGVFEFIEKTVFAFTICMCILCILSIRNRGIADGYLVWQTISFRFSFHSWSTFFSFFASLNFRRHHRRRRLHRRHCCCCLLVNRTIYDPIPITWPLKYLKAIDHRLS